MERTRTVSIAIIVISFIASACLYNYMPGRMVSHWNAQGIADGWMPKEIVLFIMPAISAALFILLLWVPGIDPLKANIEKFKKHYEMFIAALMGFFFYIHLLTIAWGLGIAFNMIQLMSPAFALLFYRCGILIENTRMNWTIGIRTRWSLSSETVWNATHEAAGMLFKVSGIIAAAGVVLPSHAIVFVIVPAMASAVYSMGYSYTVYKKEIKAKGRTAKK
jgi:uncharacterized membrane protein